MQFYVSGKKPIYWRHWHVTDLIRSSVPSHPESDGWWHSDNRKILLGYEECQAFWNRSQIWYTVLLMMTTWLIHLQWNIKKNITSPIKQIAIEILKHFPSPCACWWCIDKCISNVYQTNLSQGYMSYDIIQDVISSCDEWKTSIPDVGNYQRSSIPHKVFDLIIHSHIKIRPDFMS